MGKGGRNTEEQTQTQQDAQAAPTQSSCADKEARFMQALQRMMGDTELTEENIRDAMQNLTPEQRHELLSEGKELKQELLTNKDHAEERNLYFKEFNQRAEEAGMPIDQDGTYLAKKVHTPACPQPAIKQTPAAALELLFHASQSSSRCSDRLLCASCAASSCAAFVNRHGAAPAARQGVPVTPPR